MLIKERLNAMTIASRSTTLNSPMSESVTNSAKNVGKQTELKVVKKLMTKYRLELSFAAFFNSVGSTFFERKKLPVSIELLR